MKKILLFALISIILGSCAKDVPTINPASTSFYVDNMTEQEFRGMTVSHSVKIRNRRFNLPSVLTDRTVKPKEAVTVHFISEIAPIAIEEMKKYRIPASVTIAQAILESKFGTSELCRSSNNFFGMKCFSKKCKSGHCTNFADDNPKDFFKIYKSRWYSFRAHSKLLSGKRYRKLKKSKKYTKWAYGLRKAGYATDPKYAQKLINLIDKYKLYYFDDKQFNSAAYSIAAKKQYKKNILTEAEIKGIGRLMLLRHWSIPDLEQSTIIRYNLIQVPEIVNYRNELIHSLLINKK